MGSEVTLDFICGADIVPDPNPNALPAAVKGRKGWRQVPKFPGDYQRLSKRARFVIVYDGYLPEPYSVSGYPLRSQFADDAFWFTEHATAQEALDAADEWFRRNPND